MVTVDRWQAAQKYEQGYWQSLAGRIADGSVAQLEWYDWSANELAKRLRRLGATARTGPAERGLRTKRRCSARPAPV